MPQFSGLVNVSVALITWCLARLDCAGKVCGMTTTSISLDSNLSPNGRRRRIFGFRVRYVKWWVITTVVVLLVLLAIHLSLDSLRAMLTGRLFSILIVADIIVGALLGVGMVAWFAHFERKALACMGIDADFAYDQDVFNAVQTTRVSVAAGNAEVLQRAEDALTEYGAVVIERDEAKGQITALTPQCWRSFGDRIDLVLTNTNPCEVLIHAEPRIYPFRFVTDFGRGWEHVQALAMRMTTGAFPSSLSPNGSNKAGAMDAANTPPAIFEAGAWQRLALHCTIFAPAFLLFMRKNVHLALGCMVLGASLELFAYLKFRLQARNKVRTESQETIEVMLTNLWPALLFLTMLGPPPRWGVAEGVVAGVIGCLFTVLTVNRLRDKKRERAQRSLMVASRERAELERQLAEAKLVALSAQIEPHFLFNTLASIQYLIRNDSGKASEMTSDLIRYLRLAVPRMKQATARLADELELVRAYLGIMQIRMGSRLQFAIDSPDELADVQIPTMTLITLVENAIKHGLEQKADGGMISLMAREGIHGSRTLRLTVADTGGGFSTAVAGTGIGLANIRERLDNLYRGSAKLELEANQPTGVKAILILPMERT
jgi:two-component sensor histidine kinase